MTLDNAPVQIYVTYQGSASDRFNRDLYVNHHLPLVMSLWANTGWMASARFSQPTTRRAPSLSANACSAMKLRSKLHSPPPKLQR